MLIKFLTYLGLNKPSENQKSLYQLIMFTLFGEKPVSSLDKSYLFIKILALLCIPLFGVLMYIDILICNTQIYTSVSYSICQKLGGIVTGIYLGMMLLGAPLWIILGSIFLVSKAKSIYWKIFLGTPIWILLIIILSSSFNFALDSKDYLFKLGFIIIFILGLLLRSMFHNYNSNQSSLDESMISEKNEQDSNKITTISNDR